MLMKMEGEHSTGDIPIPGCGGFDSIGISLDQLARDIESDSLSSVTEDNHRSRRQKPAEEKEARLALNGDLQNHTDQRITSCEFSRIDRYSNTRKKDKNLIPMLRQKLRGGYCVILCALGLFLVIALVLGLAIYFAGNHIREPGSYPLTPGRYVEVHGSVRVVGGPFSIYSEALQDGASPEYIYTVTSFTFLVDNMFSTSDVFKDIYSDSEVSKISNGSVVIDFIIRVETSVSRTYPLVDEMTKLFHSTLDGSNNFGVFTLEPDSLFLWVPKQITGTSIASTGTKGPRQCISVILPVCEGMPYNFTSYPSLVGHETQEEALIAGLPYLSAMEDALCHEFLNLFWCTIFEPPCVDAMFIPPCKEFCLEIEAHCPDMSIVIELLPSGSCESLPSQSETEHCYRKPQAETSRCERRSHQLCPSMYGADMTTVPNLIGHQSQDWAVHIMYQDIIKYLVTLNCSPLVQMFACSILSPSCEEDEYGLTLVPPCQELCVAVQQQCGFFMELVDVRWALSINCSSFPMFSAGARRDNGNRCLGGREAVFSMERECDGHRCDARRCIPTEWVCDGIADCDDTTDERFCARCVGEFKCRSGLCLNRSEVCDGKSDCPDGEDEESCVRLAGRGGVRGVLEAYHGVDMVWRPVCAKEMSRQIADTVCRVVVGSESLKISERSLRSRSKNRFLFLSYKSQQLKITSGDCQRQKAVELECSLKECGLVPDPFPGVGQNEVIPTSVPWLVSLHGGPAGTFYCGGALLSKYWILTAAHCVYGLRSASGLKIRAGTTRRESAAHDFQERRAAAFYIHPDYDRKTLADDIALIRATRPFHLDSRARTACLPQEGFSATLEQNSTCFLSGWGKVSDEDSDYRREAKVRQLHWIENSECEESIHKKHPHYPHKVGDHTLCVRGCDGSDACSGDSGGAMTCWDPGTKRWTTAGVMSWSVECGNPSLPGVYTDVSQYLAWIKHHVSDS